MNIPATQRDSPLILIVDDEKFMRIQLRRAMEQSGYQVAEATDGEEALAAFTRLHPDMVLLDALMPVMDGFTCCTQLQLIPGGDRTPVLMITALESQESVNQAFEVGAIDYITKPIHWAVLRQRVRRLLQSTRTMEELRQQTERAKLSEERLRLALEAAQMGIWDWDILSGKVMHSHTTEVIHGLDPSSFEGTFKSFLSNLHPEDQELVTQALHSTLKEGSDYNIEFRILWPDGSVRWVASKGQVYYDNTGKAVRMTGINMDITDRKRAQEELQLQNRRSQLFAEVTLKIRQSLHIQEILQTTVTEVQRIFQTDRVLIFQLWLNGFGKIVTEAVNPNWISVLGRNITDDYFASEYLQRYSQGRIYTIADIEKAEVPHCLIEFMQEFEVKAKLAVPIFLKEKLWGLLVAHQCTSPRQWSSFETELMGQLADQIGIALAQAQLLEQETRQSQELARSNAELQQFASIASHDLQEPLRKIQAFGDRLKTKCNEALTEQGRDYLDRMQNAAGRMQTLIDDLLMLSRITTKAQPFVPVDLAQVIQEVLSDLEVRIDETKGQVEVGRLPTIEADSLQMRQLLQNLIGNALKFHPKTEPPKVRIYSQLLNDEEQQPTGNSITPTHCQIVVEDNGIGFDEKYLDRIFNVFQRLQGRSEYEGTGMGLAICRKIAERHGGSLTAESTPGQGATFIVTLPIKQRQGADSA
ncbi:MAG TPA: response regulator [Coleofasciculaceae cyanobacterium]|jgi:PAS domain S-box-containing protein